MTILKKKKSEFGVDRFTRKHLTIGNHDGKAMKNLEFSGKNRVLREKPWDTVILKTKLFIFVILPNFIKFLFYHQDLKN